MEFRGLLVSAVPAGFMLNRSVRLTLNGEPMNGTASIKATWRANTLSQCTVTHGQALFRTRCPS